MPTFLASGPSVSQMIVSAASNWQKKKRRDSNSSISVQCSSSRFVMLVTPGYPSLAPRPHALTDLVYQRDWHEFAGVIEALGILGRSEESSWPPSLREVEQPCPRGRTSSGWTARHTAS